jgi:hypothetical protein
MTKQRFKLAAMVLLQGWVTIVADMADAAACEVKLRSPVPVCSAVTYSAEDCEEVAQGSHFGKAGDRVHPTIIHVMSSGSVYAATPHESAIELKYLTFKGCKFKFRDRDKDESPEYVFHFIIE